MVLNSEEHPENPTSSRELFDALGKGEFIPACIRDYSEGIRLKGDQFDSLRQSEFEAVQKFANWWAPAFLQDRLFYTPFCEKEGLMTEKTEQTLVGEMKVRTPIRSFDQQTSAGLAGNMEWQEFMTIYTPPREALLKAVKEVILRIPVRNARYDPLDIQLFDKSMRIGRYMMVLTLIPNLTDPEVKGLFGPQASLAEIQKQTTTQSF